MAIVKKYQAKIVSLKNPIDGIYTLELESLCKPFKYNPGQFLHLAIDDYDPAGQWPDSRCFSMQSAPHEELIKITYAAKGQFTGRMQQQLKPGCEVTLKLPYGDLFTQPHSKTNTVFIAGGTGITPFLSLFTHESFANYINPILYAGFRSKEFNLYSAELKRAKVLNPLLSVHSIYQNEQGILDIDIIHQNAKEDSSFFISGPPVMIKTFKQTLIGQGVTIINILTDDWE